MASPIRYARLGYAALQVTDVAASTGFYVEMIGLALARRDTRSSWLRCSDKPYDIMLEQGDEAGLLRIGFELESRANLQQAFEHVGTKGHSPNWSDPAQCERQQVEAAFRFRNPQTGLELDFYCGQAVAREPFVATAAEIARLGHIVLNVRSYAAAHRFWVEDLGFAVSDHVPGKIAFLRCYPNPLHHSLALIEGASDGLNHVNFMVTDIDDIGRALNRLKKADVPIVFGPGRHLPSTSIFLYFLDPDGMTAEYSFGMEEIAAGAERAPRALEPKAEVLDMWGSVPDPRFGATGVIVHG